MKVLFFGDVVGRPGRRAVKSYLGKHREKYDLVIANAENIAGGFGVTEKTLKELLDAGVDVFTSGNHVFDKKGYEEIFKNFPILRPANYPQEVEGKGFLSFDLSGTKALVVNLLGRVFMECVDCPFKTLSGILENESADFVLVDFHAEATSEKQALANYFDGKVSAIFGTHTHVQTNDARILKSGTFFIADVGMCGAYDSIIGMDVSSGIKRFLRRTPTRFEVPKKADRVLLNAVEIEIEKGRVSSFKVINELLERGEDGSYS